MLTAAGSGYSRWRDLGVTRWREDVTRDDWGSYVFLRDVRERRRLVRGLPAERRRAGQLRGHVHRGSRRVRPAATARSPRRSRSSSRRRTTPRCAASPIANTGSRARDIELTSYAELVLAPPAADAAHPAFSKLFVQTEYLAKIGAILATRRRRSPGEPEIWAAHLAVVEGEAVGEPEIETDRARFLGRGREVRDADRGDGRPAAVEHRRHRARSDLRAAPPRAGRRRAGRCASRSGRSSRRPAARCSTSSTSTTTPTAFERAATLAWTQAQVQLSHLGIDAERGEPVSAPRRPRALRRSVAASVVRRHPPRRRRAGGALGAGHLRRPADRAACGSTTSRTSPSCASCCGPTSTGA